MKQQENARGNFGPSVWEQFMADGWPLINADQARVAGYQNAMTYLTGRRALFVDTPGNRAGIAQLMEMVTDPDYPSAILKVNADPITGEGGDDWSDMFRYGLMSRPIARPVVQTRPEKQQDRLLPWDSGRHVHSISDSRCQPSRSPARVGLRAEPERARWHDRQRVERRRAAHGNGGV